MIINLFSIFDPSITYYGLAWAPCVIPVIILFFLFKFTITSKLYIRERIIFTFLTKELEALIAPNRKKLSPMILISLFFSYLFINFIALTPFSFTPTAHLSITFTLAFIIWFSFILFGWSKNFFSIVAHMVPVGTPFQLINFIVIIEIVRNIIRPITLSVRLSANIVAGHLLIRLLGNFCLSSNIIIISFPLILILSTLELGVSFIQAYVLITLITLYSTEVH